LVFSVCGGHTNVCPPIVAVQPSYILYFARILSPPIAARKLVLQVISLFAIKTHVYLIIYFSKNTIVLISCELCGVEKLILVMINLLVPIIHGLFLV